MSSDTGRARAVVCLSGGMDSCVCAALAARDYEVYAIHFSYGQRTEARELRSAQEIARLTGVRELLVLKIAAFESKMAAAVSPKLRPPVPPLPDRKKRGRNGPARTDGLSSAST